MAKVVHFEIPYEDGDRARAFYAETFGWELMPMPEMEYTGVSTGPMGEQGPTEPGYIGGGLFRREGPHTGPNVVLDVEDVDAALESVVAHGGTVVTERQPVGDMGWVGYFRDPEGNLLGLWQTRTG